MMKRIVHTVLWLALIAWFAVIMGFVSKSKTDVLCTRLDIDISDSAAVRFITSGQVREMIGKPEWEVQGYPLEEIQTRKMEKSLETNPFIRNAEVYTTVNGVLHVDILQRTPLLRVMPGGEPGYYLDREGYILPLKTDYSPNVLLVTGHIHLSEMTMENGIIPTEAVTGKEVDAEVGMLLDFASYIAGHPFWKHQVVQLYRARNGDYEIIPRVGAHQIILGNLEGYAARLRNLKLLYDQGLSRHGWNSYDRINLKYSNQVICKKR